MRRAAEPGPGGQLPILVDLLVELARQLDSMSERRLAQLPEPGEPLGFVAAEDIGHDAFQGMPVMDDRSGLSPRFEEVAVRPAVAALQVANEPA